LVYSPNRYFNIGNLSNNQLNRSKLKLNVLFLGIVTLSGFGHSLLAPYTSFALVLIAKTSIVSASNILSNAVFIDHLCVLSAQTSVGFGVHIKRGSQIGHHNTIGDFTDINPGVVTSGNVKIGRGCEIGVGATINNNVTIGDNTFIGMGSVVTKDIPANSIAYGSPCKVIRLNNLWRI